MFISLPITPQKFTAYSEVMQTNVEKSRLEKGNISFDAFKDDQSNIYVFERWENQKVLAEHGLTEHLKAVKAENEVSLRTNEKRILMNIKELSSYSPAKKNVDQKTTRNVFITYKVKPEEYDKFLQTLLEVVPHARSAKGNIQFDVFKDIDSPFTLLLVERWHDIESHEAHRVKDYNAKFMEIRSASLLVSPEKSRKLLNVIDNCNN